MSKIILNTNLKNSKELLVEKNLIGILKGNKILFKERDYTVNISYLKNTITMTRKKENQIIKLKLNNKEKSNIEYNINDLTFYIPIITKKCVKQGNSVIIHYQILDTKEDVYYEINYKED